MKTALYSVKNPFRKLLRKTYSKKRQKFLRKQVIRFAAARMFTRGKKINLKSLFKYMLRTAV